jgi:hypothetical protein
MSVTTVNPPNLRVLGLNAARFLGFEVPATAR